MAGLIRRLFRRERENPPAGPAADTYRLRERVIYRYFDGEKEVAADPMELYLKVTDVGTDLWADAKLAYSPSKDAHKGYRAMIAKMRRIFAVKPLAEGGLTDPEVNGLFDHFMDYVDALKKNSRPSPTSRTAPSPASSSPAAEGPPTPNSSDSGSTGNEPSTDGPTLSASALA